MQIISLNYSGIRSLRDVSANRTERSTVRDYVASLLRNADPAQFAAITVCGLLGIATLTSAVSQHFHAAHSLPSAAALGLAPVTVPVTVSSGDTLWSLASRYGDPDRYIQDRVDSLAKANHLSSSESLLPGQRLLIPVANPVELARLQPHLAHR